MKHNIQNVKKAREMRLSGKSLSEISKESHIPVSTLSNWFRDIVLTNEQRAELGTRVSSRVSRGRMNSSILLRSSRMFRERKVFEEAEREFKESIKDPFFVSGVSLYWVNGAKKGSSFQFSNSDSEIYSLMMKWIKKYLKVENIKMRNYGGYKRIDICDINVLRKMIAWQKLLIQYYKEVNI